MGASGWEYVVPYQAELQAALDDLRRWEFMEDSGTHSIIDVLGVVAGETSEQGLGRYAPSRTWNTRTASARLGPLARPGTASAVIPFLTNTWQNAGPDGR